MSLTLFYVLKETKSIVNYLNGKANLIVLTGNWPVHPAGHTSQLLSLVFFQIKWLIVLNAPLVFVQLHHHPTDLNFGHASACHDFSGVFLGELSTFGGQTVQCALWHLCRELVFWEQLFREQIVMNGRILEKKKFAPLCSSTSAQLFMFFCTKQDLQSPLTCPLANKNTPGSESKMLPRENTADD